MGRPYQVHEAKPVMLPAHPLALPFDLGEFGQFTPLRITWLIDLHSIAGVIAHAELQEIVGQVMDTFRDRIYGLPSASDEMPSQTVMKVSHSKTIEF